MSLIRNIKNMKVGQGFHSGPNKIREMLYGSSCTTKINHIVEVNCGYVVKQNKKSTIVALSGPSHVALFDKETGNFVEHGCTYNIYCIHNNDAFNAILHSSCEDVNKPAKPIKSISGRIVSGGYRDVC